MRTSVKSKGGTGAAATTAPAAAFKGDRLQRPADFFIRSCPKARRAAVMSILPGVGQLYNGETGKGLLFISIACANVALLIAAILNQPICFALQYAAANLHRQANVDLAKPFQEALAHSPVLLIYIGLLTSFVIYAMREAYDRAMHQARSGEVYPAFTFTLPEAASGSYLGHFAVIAAFLIMVVFFVTPQPPKQQTTVIELMPMAAPKAPPKPKEPKLQPKKIVIEKPVVKPQVAPKVVPPKPQPVAVAVPTTEPTPLTIAAAPEPAPQPVAPAEPATGGNTGGTGGTGTAEAVEVDLGPYMDAVQKRIKKKWFPPKGEESKRLVVTFNIRKNGQMTGMKLKKSSGVSIADDAAMQAVQDAAPFDPLPAGITEDSIEINFTFDYNVFGGRHGF
jgi:TonB family protein